MQKIKNWFLRLLVVLIALAMIGVLLVMLINNRVKSQTKDDILYAMQADMEINAVSKQNLKDFQAECAIVLGCRN